ncbi:MAG: GTP-dependent dephospho-CoA kinase family protein [Candidatus Bathyarchaeia archaeon]
MATDYCITPEVLSRFKQPFGTVVEGNFSETMRKLRKRAEEEKATVLVSVGDTVSRNMHRHNLVPQLSITDDKSMRRKLKPKIFPAKKLIKVRNPPGTISHEAITAIRKALRSHEHFHILVEGEEDMLTLVAVLYAPENALVIYGLPHKGIVAVKVTQEKRAEAEEILKGMKATQRT